MGVLSDEASGKRALSDRHALLERMVESGTIGLADMAWATDNYGLRDFIAGAQNFGIGHFQEIAAIIDRGAEYGISFRPNAVQVDTGGMAYLGGKASAEAGPAEKAKIFLAHLLVNYGINALPGLAGPLMELSPGAVLEMGGCLDKEALARRFVEENGLAGRRAGLVTTHPVDAGGAHLAGEILGREIPTVLVAVDPMPRWPVMDALLGPNPALGMYDNGMTAESLITVHDAHELREFRRYETLRRKAGKAAELAGLGTEFLGDKHTGGFFVGGYPHAPQVEWAARDRYAELVENGGKLDRPLVVGLAVGGAGSYQDELLAVMELALADPALAERYGFAVNAGYSKELGEGAKALSEKHPGKIRIHGPYDPDSLEERIEAGRATSVVGASDFIVSPKPSQFPHSAEGYPTALEEDGATPKAVSILGSRWYLPGAHAEGVQEMNMEYYHLNRGAAMCATPGDVVSLLSNGEEVAQRVANSAYAMKAVFAGSRDGTRKILSFALTQAVKGLPDAQRAEIYTSLGV